jgi:catalase
MAERPALTIAAGIAVGDNRNSATAAALGPEPLRNVQRIENVAHQNRERIPERAVHAKGGGAHGTARITGDKFHAS